MRNRRLLLSLGLIIFSTMLIGVVSASSPDLQDGAQQTGYVSGGGVPDDAPAQDPAAAGAAGRTITVTDDTGKTVALQGIPQRIVSLAPSNTEILYALGLDDRIVGVTDNCDFPSVAADKPKVGGYSTISIEKVIAAEPDLVVAAPGNTDEVIDHLQTLGMTVVLLDPQTIDDVMREIELLGAVTGEEEQAAACVRELQARIRAVTDKTEVLAEKSSVAHVVWHDPIWVSGNGTFQNEVITLAGGINAFGTADEWSTVSLEEFIAADPDYILVSSGSGMNRDAYDAIYNYIMSEPRLQKLDAVRNGHVYVVDADVVSRGGPRIVDALEEVAGYLHPDLFGADAPTQTPAVQSPGFDGAALTGALFIAFLLGTKR